MNNTVVQTLVNKDLGISRLPLFLYALLGVVALVFLNISNETAFYLGFFLILTAVVSPGIHMINTTIMNERKTAVLPFVLSLPVSYMDYTKAKFLTNAIAFLVPWFFLISAAIVSILLAPQLPDGLIPVTCILLGAMVVGFFFMLAVAMITESEAWSVAAIVFHTSTIWLVVMFVFRFEAIYTHIKTENVVWNKTSLSMLAVEFGIVLFTIALLFYCQSRKRDFL